jgi:hypothetical protein
MNDFRQVPTLLRNPMVSCLTFVSVAVFLTGCQTYSLKEVGQKAYLVNQYTGTVSVIENGSLSEVSEAGRTPKQVPSATTSQDFSLASVGNLTVHFSRKWREDSMFYIATVSPYEGTLKKVREGLAYRDAFIKIDFEDEDGFEIYSLRLPVSDMIRIIDYNQKAVSLVLKGHVSMSSATYLSIKSASVEWSGFPEN